MCFDTCLARPVTSSFTRHDLQYNGDYFRPPDRLFHEGPAGTLMERTKTTSSGFDLTEQLYNPRSRALCRLCPQVLFTGDDV